MVCADFDLRYFNSSSAKFLYDIFGELARLKDSGCQIEARWYHDREDTDLADTGRDIADHSGIEMMIIAK